MTRDGARKFIRQWDDHNNHLGIIRKFAEGATLQILNKEGEWEDMLYPNIASFTTDTYRIKPQTIEVKGWVCVSSNCMVWELGDIRTSRPDCEEHWQEFTITVEHLTNENS